VFGKLRYMTSENTARKVRVKDYIRRYGPGGGQGELSLS
jgi:deoxyribodipyrimidine photo-lyase